MQRLSMRLGHTRSELDVYAGDVRVRVSVRS